MSICDRLWQAACNIFGLLDLTITYLNLSIFRQSKSVREKSSVTEASFCHKTNSVTEIGFCHTKVSFTEASFNNRNKCCPHAHPLELKVLQNLSFFLFCSECLPKSFLSSCFPCRTKWEDNICWPDKSFSSMGRFSYGCFLRAINKFSVHLISAVCTKHTSLASQHMQNFEKTCFIVTYYIKT